VFREITSKMHYLYRDVELNGFYVDPRVLSDAHKFWKVQQRTHTAKLLKYSGINYNRRNNSERCCSTSSVSSRSTRHQKAPGRLRSLRCCVSHHPIAPMIFKWREETKQLNTFIENWDEKTMKTHTFIPISRYMAL